MPIRKSVQNRKPSLREIAAMPFTVGQAAMRKHYGVEPPCVKVQRLEDVLVIAVSKALSLKDSDPLPEAVDKALVELGSYALDLASEVEDYRDA